jgi:hypothetical protein
VQHDAARKGSEQRAKGEGGAAASESAEGGDGERDANKHAEREHPEAPRPVIGMNDERGGVSAPFFFWEREGAFVGIGADGV